MSNIDLREKLIKTACALNTLGLSRGNSGNVSVVIPEGLLITPTGVPYGNLEPADIPLLRRDGTYEGKLAPSSEAPFHLAIAKAFPDEAKAIVHCHSPFATVLSCSEKIQWDGIPAFHYMVAIAGGNTIRCAPYATFGTEELSRYAVEALRGRRACLLANHGQIAVGKDLNAALKLAQEVEGLAFEYYHVLSLRDSVILSEEEMAVVLEKFQTYGQPKK